MAVSTSAHTIALLDPTTMKPSASFAKAHDDRINELTFAPAKTLVSGSSDGTVKIWDAAQAGPLATLRCADDEVWSVSAEGSYLAAGTNKAVVVWDVRQTRTPLARYEMHTEAVTQVRFVPGTRRLVSGSMDELVCVLDTSQQEEDDAVLGVHNVQSPVVALGLYGAANEASGGAAGSGPLLAWVLSSTDIVQLWDLDAAERIASLDTLVRHESADHLAETEVGARDAAAAAGASGGGSGRHAMVPFDFVAGCAWEAHTHTLWMLGGDKSGAAHIFTLPPTTLPVSRLTRTTSTAPTGGEDGGDDADVELPPPASVQGPVVHALSLPARSGGGAHDDSVRCFHLGGSSEGPVAILTGGEDGRVAAWARPEPRATLQVAAAGAAAAVGGSGPGKAAKDAKAIKRAATPYERPAKARGGTSHEDGR